MTETKSTQATNAGFTETEFYLKAFIPQQVAGVLQKLAPLFVLLGHSFQTALPYLIIAFTYINNFWIAIQPYHPKDLIPAVMGLCMAFFGGHFLLLFAAVEAYRMCGWDQTKYYISILYEDGVRVWEASKQDDQEDLDGDGVADVKQITPQQLLNRKLRLVIRTIQPDKFSSALSGLYMGFLGVVAVLRVKFAQTIALGATIGGIFKNFIEPIATPTLEIAIPNEYRKWIPVIIQYGCKLCGVSIAWTLQRVMSSFYTGIRGGQMFANGILAYLAKEKYLSVHYDESSMVSIALVGAIAFLGFFWQVSTRFYLPFPFNIMLFPLTCIEYLLTWFVAVQSY